MFGLEMSVVLEFVISAIALGVSIVWSLPKVQKWREQMRHTAEREIWAFVREAVQETYESYVRSKKRAAEDGKLTDRERAEARQMALDKVLDKVNERAPKLLANYAKGRILSAIEEAVQLEKK